MAPRRDRGASKALGKRLAQASQDVTISEPIFPTLVRAFYSRVTYGHGGPITSTVRGVQIPSGPGEHLPHFGHSSWWTLSI
ncbi:hypothetical protein CK203_087861 [Vitis vinifera]|uniref:Uncharacterized protein n=1 Tax=Vitis vinifera TaxID=29760 RepID=A0A438DQU9_VITVI|nr:hypothetical protein CK203_087861 [Vitis vinifera]